MKKYVALGIVIGQILPYLYLLLDGLLGLGIVYTIVLCCFIGVSIMFKKRIVFKHSELFYHCAIPLFTTFAIELSYVMLSMIVMIITKDYFGAIMFSLWVYGFTRIYTIPIACLIIWRFL